MSINSGCAYSTSFRVKNVEALEQELSRLTPRVAVRHPTESDTDNTIYLVATTGFWPDQRWLQSDGSETEEDINFLDVLYPHLEQDQIAHLRGISHEGSEDLWFTHWTVNDKGEKIYHDVDTLDRLARDQLAGQPPVRDVVQLMAQVMASFETPDDLTEEERAEVRQDATDLINRFENN